MRMYNKYYLLTKFYTMRKTTKLLWLCLLFLSFAGCKDDDEADSITLDSETIVFDNGAAMHTVMYSSSAKAWASCEADWVFPEMETDQLTISVEENSETVARTAVVVIKAGNCERHIDVLQKGKAASLELTAEKGYVYDLNTQYAVGVKTNQKWTATVSGSWMKIEPASGNGNDVIKISFDYNTTPSERVGSVTVTVADNSSRTFTLTQSEALPNSLLHDSLALVAIYHAMQGDQWSEKDRTNWLKPGAPISSWAGVTTHKGRVWQLVLANRNIGAYGKIPPEIKYLVYLENLSLLNTQIGGEIPLEIGRCISLSFFNARSEAGGNLRGTLPVNFYSLTDLRNIDVENNKMEGELPWEYALGKCSQFTLSSNNFSGELPAIWGVLNPRFLNTLFLSNNQMTGTIPAEWGNMRSLGVLFLRNNSGMYGKIPQEVCNLIGTAALESIVIDGTDIIPCD